MNTLKQIIRESLPTRYFLSSDSLGERNVYLTFAPMRSGQHAVIDWICRGMPEGVIHFNLCGFIREGLRYVLWPWNGRWVLYGDDEKHDSGEQGRSRFREENFEELPENLLFSMEDRIPLDFGFSRLVAHRKCSMILILRDPANWLASSLGMKYKSKEALLSDLEMIKVLLRIALKETAVSGDVFAINYCDWCRSPEYRHSISKQFTGFKLSRAEAAIKVTPDFGGGSSFSGDVDKTNSTLDRWNLYKEDSFFISALRDPELLRLSQKFFGNISAVSFLETLVNQGDVGNSVTHRD